jgi:hypothetical protein
MVTRYRRIVFSPIFAQNAKLLINNCLIEFQTIQPRVQLQNYQFAELSTLKNKDKPQRTQRNTEILEGLS